MAFSVKTGKIAPKSVPSLGTKFLHGTYPPSPSMEPMRIKPMGGQTQYGKTAPKPPPAFGSTGLTGES